ncbi:YfiT family bacillithiol transferase [Fontibacillus sp. BL9]|uniref:YfiT family bacillithiol transferase n=1 Tax=Fontibacillus sp. BL9 TaxID=3389971 RepID=UPI00397B19C3
MDRRYPIGTFRCERDISATQREMWIREIEELPARLKEAVKGLSEDQLNLPYRERGWTLRQVVHHLADSHMISFIRFKLALTEDTPTIRPYFEDRWAELQDSKETDIQISFMLLEGLHKRWAILLKSMEKSDFEKQFYHPESQQTVRLDYNLGYYAWHGKHHTAHITALRNLLNI